MLNKEWADGYDRSTARSDADGSYPFAGYNEILHEICRRVLSRGQETCSISASARVC